MRRASLALGWFVLGVLGALPCRADASDASPEVGLAESDRQAPLVSTASTGEGSTEPSVTRPPRLTHFVKAVYPPAQKARGVTASVVLSIDLDASGRVAAVSVAESGGPEFDAAALAAARQFTFEPGEVDGRPAPVTLTYRYRFTLRAEAVQRAPQVNLEGLVKDRFSKKPVPGVTVRCVDAGVSSVTDAAGRFEFTDLPPGSHALELSGPSLVSVSTQEQVSPGKRRRVTYLVEQREEGVDEERVLRAPRIKKETVEVTIRTEEARRVPGSQGDTLKVVQNLPGVARSQAGSGALVVWGSAPQDTRINVDGVEIPALYHMGALRSTLPSDFVRGIQLLPGAYGADFGRGLGGLVNVETQPLPTSGVHGYVEVNAIDSSAMLTAALSDRVRVSLSGRYGYLDKVLQRVVSPDVGDFFPLPSYDDYQARVTVALRKGEELSATLLGSDDRLTRVVPSADPGSASSETEGLAFQRVYLRYTHLLEDGSSLSVVPYVGFDQSRAATSFGAVPTDLSIRSTLVGLRASYRAKVARVLTLTTGLDALGTASSVSRFGSLTLPAREGDVTVFGQPPGDDVNADAWRARVVNVAPYVLGELSLGRLTLTPGLRADIYAIEASRLTPRVGSTPSIGSNQLTGAIDPRVSAVYALHPRWSLTASAGIYHQGPAPEDLSAVFGTPTLGISRAFHLTAGASARLTGTLSAEVVGFYKYLDGLVLRNPLPTPPLAEALVQDGEGQSYGAQLLIRQELFHNVFGWLSYTLSRSERRHATEDAFRLLDYDQTHVLALVASWQYRGWGVGARFRCATGMPRTPVTGSFFDARDDVYQPIFGAQNSIRIPPFYQLDVRLDRRFVFGGLALNLFLDVQNVTNRANPEEIVYNDDYSARGYVTGLPILPILGARLEF